MLVEARLLPAVLEDFPFHAGVDLTLQVGELDNLAELLEAFEQLLGVDWAAQPHRALG